MQILGYLRRPSLHAHYCTSSIVSSINWVRDRALDHAVEKERDLKPMFNIKNLLISEPSKSLPITIISDKRTSLGIPNSRPIDFIRKYPSVFQEFLPGGIGIHPHVKLTQETLDLHSEQVLFFDTNDQKQDVANRLLKLLMIARVNKLPLCVIDRLKWDLGLPNDYEHTIVPYFPDYFQVNTSNELELVCWSNKLAVSVMKKNKLTSFPMQYSRGFEMDNKFKKWVDDWQKLPYFSPYENLLGVKSDEELTDKWIVGLLHEVLNILVPKKTEKDNLLFLGECLGVRSRFKRALLQHPGIFYVSSKLHTHTVVLREAYKRDLLVSKPLHPLMYLRSAYIHLMNMVKLEEKNKSEDNAQVANEGGEDDDEWSETKSENEQDDDSEIEDITDSEKEDNLVATGRTPTHKATLEGGQNDSVQRGRRQEESENGNTRIRGRPSRTMKFNDSPRRNTPNARGSENDGRRRGRERTRKNVLNEKTDSRSNRMSDLRTTNQRSDRITNQMSDRRDTWETNGPKISRTEAPGTRKDFGRLSKRSSASRTREGRF